MHPDEIALSDDVVRELIATQFPKWADRPIRRVVSGGTVNRIFRIGDHLAARFQLRTADPAETRAILEREMAAGRLLVGRSIVPVPIPVAIGAPGWGYPLPWSVQSWVAGTTAIDADASGSVDFAHDLAEFIAVLRATDTEGRRFEGENRGGDIRAHDGWVQTCFDRSEHLLDVPTLRALWRTLRDLPRESPDAMTHGDLIPGNILVADGRLTGVLDGGGFGPADPALDVIAGWHLLEHGARAAFRAHLGCDDLEWERSRAWAFEQSIGAVWYYASTNPAMSEMGRQTLRRIVDDNQRP